MPSLLIMTHSRDLHGHVIQQLLADRVDVRILAVDQVLGNEGWTWRADRTDLVAADFQRWNFDAVWLRRTRIPRIQGNDAAQNLAVEEANAYLEGIALTHADRLAFNPYLAARRAENKLIQLRWAQAAGLNIPRTIVTQECEQLEAFVRDVGTPVITKKLRGLTGQRLETVRLSDPADIPCPVLRACPTMVQEEIPGSRHLRLVVWGDTMHMFQLESEALDWRPAHPKASFVPNMDQGFASKIRAFMRLSGLQMGSFDFKLDAAGEPVFLEVNQQGQFLFLQEDTGVDLARSFADFVAGKLGNLTSAAA